MERLFKPSWRGYVVALAALAGALVIRYAIDPWVRDSVPFITVFAAIIFAVWYSGLLPALLIAVLGYIAASYLFIAPESGWSFGRPSDVVTLIMFVLSAGLLIALGTRMHAARLRAEDAEARFRAFMDHSPDCLFIRDEEGRYVFMSRAAERLFGLEEAQWKGRDTSQVLPAETHALLQAADREVRESRRPMTREMVYPTEHVTRYFRVTLFPLPGPGGRQFLGSLATDITESRRAAEEALEARKQLQMVTDALPVAVLWTGSDRRYRWVNPEFARWLRKAPAELVGVKMDDAIGPHVVEVIEPHVRRVLAGEPVTYERIARLPGLGERWISMTLTPIRTEEGAIDGWVTIGTDIHDRRLAEERLREADRRKDEFLAMLAHELRNPLAPIRNAVAILRRKGAHDPEVSWSREVIDRQVQQMSRLIDDLLDIERISRGKLLVKKERIALEKVIDMALETSRPHILAAGHHLSVVMPSERVAVEGDPTRLAQVFANLLNNSARYTEAGGSISVTAAVEDREVAVTVEDNGVGFSPDTAAALFAPFSQLERTKEKAAGGLGIGLSLVQGIVALHGGRVEAHSEGPGQGSRFVVHLPVAGQAALVPTPAPAREEPAGAGVRVLVADDNRDAADSLQRVLRLYGHEVRVCYDGPSAIDVAREFRPRVAVLDIGMPGANGYEVARAIRDEEEGKTVVLVAMTGWGQESDRRQALEAGFDHHMTKPVDPGALNNLLAEATK